MVTFNANANVEVGWAAIGYLPMGLELGFEMGEGMFGVCMLQLSMPNIILMDLVVSFLSYLIRVTYICFSFSFSHPCLMHSSSHSSLCSAWLCSSFLLFHSATTMQLLHAFLPFHGNA